MIEGYEKNIPIYIYKGERVDDLVSKLCKILSKTVNRDNTEEVIGYILIQNLSDFEKLPNYIGYLSILFGWQFIVSDAINKQSQKVTKTLHNIIDKFFHYVVPDYYEKNVLLEVFCRDVLFDACVYYFRDDNYAEALVSALRDISNMHLCQKDFDYGWDISSRLTAFCDRDIRGVIYENEDFISFDKDLRVAACKNFIENILCRIDFGKGETIEEMKALIKLLTL